MSNIFVLDADDDAPDESLPSRAPASGISIPRRTRGRPRKALGSVILEADDRIGLSDMAFMRAAVQGVDLGKAADLYLVRQERIDPRTAHAYLRKLLKRVRRAAMALADRDEALAKLRVLAEEEPIPVSPALPTLEEFALRFDDGMYSERELQELFEEEYGGQAELGRWTGDVASPGALVRRKLEVLSWLHVRLGSEPSANDPLNLWLDQALADRIRLGGGAVTLGQLATYLNAGGRHWYKSIPGLGRVRAARILTWLYVHEPHIGVALSPRMRRGMKAIAQVPRVESDAWLDDARVVSECTVTPNAPPNSVVVGHARSANLNPAVDDLRIYGLVPLDMLDWPSRLDGSAGTFRSSDANMLGAGNDREAFEAWKRVHLVTKSAHTQRSYERSIERLVLWALVERRKALSSLAADDMAAFRDFLLDPPAHWITRWPTMRYSQDWRPLRGPLDPRSVQQTLAAIGTMFQVWHDMGYLRANPMRGVGIPHSSTARLDTAKHFADEDLVAIRRCLESMPDTPTRRRLRATLLLLQTAGLRREELERLCFGDIALGVVGGQISDVWVARILGKGSKLRDVPLKPSVMEALELHYADRMALIAQGVLPGHYGAIPKGETPVLSILTVVRAGGAAGPGDGPADAARTDNPDGRLAAGSVYSLLKAFFAKVASMDGLLPGQAQRLEAASTHWLRHTFAHQALRASGGALQPVQQLLGHENINTTAIYTKADLEERVRTIQAINDSV